MRMAMRGLPDGLAGRFDNSQDRRHSRAAVYQKEMS
jgi:hypothetical protein